MILEQRAIGGVVREQWDDTAGGTYTEFDGAGVVVSTRPFSAVELAWLTDLQALQLGRSNAEALKADGRAGIDLVLAKIADVQGQRDTLAGLPASTITQANFLRNALDTILTTQVFLLRAVVRIARYLFGATDSTNIG